MTVAWLIGRFDAEAASLPSALAESFPGAGVRAFRSPDDAMAASVPPPDVVLVSQRRPAEFPRRDIDRLIGGNPLARFVVALGPWCASDGRSQWLWPEAVAVPVWDAVRRLRDEADAIAGRRPPLPTTAGRDEVVLADTLRHDRPHVRVEAVSPDAAFAAWLVEAVGKALPAPRGCAPDAILFDADPVDRDRLAALAEVRATHPGVRVLALAAVPCGAVVRSLRRAGADAVLAKPCLADELRRAVRGDA